MTTKTRSVRLSLDIVPIPTPRPRVTKFGSTYYPASYRKYVDDLAGLIPDIDVPFTGQIAIYVDAVCKPLKASKFDTPMGDVDNFAKGVLDTLTKRNYWDDDRQIVSLLSTKRFPSEGEGPHINVTIHEHFPDRSPSSTQ